MTAENTKDFAYWQKRILAGATFAYTIYYFCRVNISIAIPVMQKSMGVSKAELGLIASALQITYGVGKFANGVMGDRSNPRYFMAAGLFLTGVANLAFGGSTALGVLALIWAINGWVQSMGFPAGAKLLSYYYPRSEHGRSWTLFGCSHQVGAYIILVVGGYLAMAGWRNVFLLPGVLAILCSLIVFAVLRDVPHNNKELAGAAAMAAPERPPLWEGLKRIGNNRFIWSLALGNLFLYIVRYGLLTWSASFLVSQRGMSVVSAGWLVGIFEFAGLFGGLSAGWISDLRSKGNRGPVMTVYMLILTLAITSLWFAPANPIAIGLAIAACGFFVYGPLMLVSVAAAGHVRTELAASAAGLAGLFGYIGATISGAGLGATAEHAGWPAVFALLIGSSVASAICFGFTIAAPLPESLGHDVDESKQAQAIA